MLPPSPVSGIIASGVGRAWIGPTAAGTVTSRAESRKARCGAGDLVVEREQPGLVERARERALLRRGGRRAGHVGVGADARLDRGHRRIRRGQIGAAARASSSSPDHGSSSARRSRSS